MAGAKQTTKRASGRTQGRRVQIVERMNLSEHSLDINIRKCNYDKFRFPEVEDFVLALTGGRTYQYDAIKQGMIYLWAGAI